MHTQMEIRANPYEDLDDGDIRNQTVGADVNEMFDDDGGDDVSLGVKPKFQIPPIGLAKPNVN